MKVPMSWLPGACGQQRRIRKRQPFALVENLETRALLTTVTVHVVNFAFTPDPVTINVGDTVHWVWDTPDHSTTSVTGSAESWDSGVHDVGFTFDHKFTHAGAFVYYCVVHGSDNGNGTASGMAGTITVQATGTLTSITLMPPNPSIAVGATEQFMAMGAFSDGTTRDVTSQATWASANSSVATISNASGSNGLATGVAAGTSTITATLNGVTGSAPLTVGGTPTPPLPSSIGRFKSSGLKIQAKLDKTYHGYVAYFHEPHTSPQNFHAAIDWGDHSKKDPGHVHGRGNGHFAIIGQHRYVRPGAFDITVTIRDSAFRKIATESLVRVVP
jgi:plastocyanin